MTTLRLPPAAELPDADRIALERTASRLGSSPDELADIWRAQMHWPDYLEANRRQTLRGYRFQGAVPELAKEAMHVAVSAVNDCEY